MRKKFKMNIRKKLILSDILIIVVPVLIAVVILAIFTAGPGAQTWETMENLFDDRDGIYTAQSEMQTLEWRGDLKGVKSEMKAAGYHFRIVYQGKVMYSSLTKDDIAEAKKAVGDLYDRNSNLTYTKGSTSVVLCYSAEDNYRAVAVSTASIPASKGDMSYMERYIMLYIGFLIAIIIAVVVLMNMIMSWWIARNILLPLRKLSTASALIREGNLDFDIVYPKNDEMGDAISEFNEMRKSLKESVDERIRYEQYRRELINGISHDLRTPLTSIKGYVAGLRDGIASTPEKKMKYYEAIETSATVLENLVEDLTNFSRVDMGETHLNMELTDLTEYYRKSAEEISTEYVKDNVTISLDVPAEKVTAKIDRKEMGRINRNIIDNTIKYRTGDSSNIRVSLHVTDAGRAEVRITDDGPGVAEKDLENIFTCFYRGDISRTRSSEGSGIGLAVVRQLIVQQGGSVHAENDGGLAIVMDIPLAEGGEDE
ncbi:MAG: HAMP domain-containing histidine kinase [Eubacteriaceae bacterium]|jgi:signal transduction histidine kinase|nr:HAMP domain-containing histidine kinase [Eubacteriaceae bacterium]